MGTDRLVYIRTDGNSSIATGHLVRCLSIADACLLRGMKVCFLVSDKESKELLQNFDPLHRFPVQILETADYHDPERELPEVLALLNGLHRADAAGRHIVYFLDSYFVTEKYLSDINAATPVAYLDDLKLFDYPVDLVINYDVIPEAFLPDYRKCYQRAKKTLLGAAYTPLRSQFADRKPGFRDQVSDILITTGGSDPFHFCLKLANTLLEKPSGCPTPSFNLQIVVGRLNKDKEALCRLSEHFPSVTLHENVSDMASLMESCDLAVSAAGTTLYELCAAGTPAVSFTMADNQLTAAKAFADAGAIPCAGDIRLSCESVLDSVIDFVTYMSVNLEQRKSAQDNMRRLVDGQGALRIADALSKL